MEKSHRMGKKSCKIQKRIAYGWKNLPQQKVDGETKERKRLRTKNTP